ncbi:four-carbon acid sugar kinase family protein [Xanthobacteraceae bacterium A53D]
MARRWFILADDLTGAADCAIAFGRRGFDAAVSWGEAPLAGARPPVFSYDADSRNMSATEAAERHRTVLEALSDADRILFKKIDSTLRGQPASETAATIAVLKAQHGAALGIFAPAFPATGRTTVDGRILVAGRPLEDAEVWKRDHSYASADLVAVMATSGIAAQVVPLAVVRGDIDALKAAIFALTDRGVDIAVCDAETDDDLDRIAKAALAGPRGTFFIGSAGLAHALAENARSGDAVAPVLCASQQGWLMVVGSLAAASRAGARKLVSAGEVSHVPVEPDVLLNDPEGRAALGRQVVALLDGGRDVLVEILMTDKPDMSLGHRLVEGLADALQPAATRMGAFAATGGETAAALLSSFGVNGIRLAEEIEPGVALGVTLGTLSVPVVTKAGAFGDENSLSTIAARLRTLRSKGNQA